MPLNKPRAREQAAELRDCLKHASDLTAAIIQEEFLETLLRLSLEKIYHERKLIEDRKGEGVVPFPVKHNAG
jgi:hypothetical protein